MNRSETFEHYPARLVAACNLVSWPIYAIGVYVLASLWTWLIIPYLLCVLWLEVRLLRMGREDYVYYGSVFAFGKGRICALAFEKGDPRRFAERETSWLDMLPDLLISVVPLMGGAALLILEGWSWRILTRLLLLLGLSSAGTGFVRGALACPHCQQRTLGCPAYELFKGRSGG